MALFYVKPRNLLIKSWHNFFLIPLNLSFMLIERTILDLGFCHVLLLCLHIKESIGKYIGSDIAKASSLGVSLFRNHFSTQCRLLHLSISCIIVSMQHFL